MNLKRHYSTIIGVVLCLTGLAFVYWFSRSVNFSMDPFQWFAPSYYEQFIPLFLAGTLVVGGAFTLLKHPKTNFYLALFGHATVEAIVFDWLGLESAHLAPYAASVLLPISLIVLWIAYTNLLKLRKLSLMEALVSIIIATVLVLFPVLG